MALVTQFLSSIRGFVLQQDGEHLCDWLKVEQNVPQQYYELKQQLRSSFPPQSKALERIVEKCLPEEDDTANGKGSPWPGFVSFMGDFLQYWRDVDFDDLLGLHDLLSTLLTSCATALSNPTYGTMMLNTSISLSESMSKLVMILNRRPELRSQIRVAVGEEETKSIVESAADTIQKIFTSCLTDRSSTRWSKPEGKKVGVYIFANLVLKLLFTCNKSRLAVQMFTNIAASGPALALYPSAQRVTYLYYLGRFYFEHNNFLRASICLREAYAQTPRGSTKHRRLILTYLIPTNILLGRFPTETLLNRPEATGLTPIFRPLVQSIKAGNFVTFQAVLKANEPWLFRHGLFITLNYRLRPFLWRCLARRTFLLTYIPPADAATSRKAATLDLRDLFATVTYQQHLLEGWTRAAPPPPGRPHQNQNPLFLKAVRNSAAAAESTLTPPPLGKHIRLRPCDGVLCGNLAVTQTEVEGMVATLVSQGLMHGFVAHGPGKFAVIGTKLKGSAVLAGWPVVASAVRDRMADQGAEMQTVPAWVQAP